VSPLTVSVILESKAKETNDVGFSRNFATRNPRVPSVMIDSFKDDRLDAEVAHEVSGTKSLHCQHLVEDIFKKNSEPEVAAVP